MSNSTVIAKPSKPSPDYPLFPHASGRWAKKVEGRMAYFGPWSDPAGALAKWEAQKDDLLAGRRPEGRQPPAAGRPAKPSKDFPLFPHATRRWAKKVRGRTFYFGPWDDPQGALEEWLRVKDDLLAGKTPRPRGTAGLVLRRLCDEFRAFKLRQLEAGEIARTTYQQYEKAGRLLCDFFGRERLVSDLEPDDFGEFRAELAKRYGTVALGAWMQWCRSIFKFGYDNRYLDAPVLFGTQFAKPSRKTIRRALRNRAPRLLTPEEVKKLLWKSGPVMKAMILLGINCGYGATDIS